MPPLRVTTVCLSVLVLLAVAVPARAIAQDAYEYDDTASSGSNLGLNTTQSHNFHDQGDVDWVWISVVAGTTYRVRTFALGAACDTYIEMYRPDGVTLLTQNDDNPDETDGSSKIDFEADVTGYYLVRVFHSPASPLAGYGTGATYTLGFGYVFPFVIPGNIFVTVNSATGASISQVTVVLTCLSPIWARTVQTGPSDTFDFPSMRPGTYRIEATAQDYSSGLTTGTLPNGGTLTRTLILAVLGGGGGGTTGGGCAGSKAATSLQDHLEQSVSCDVSSVPPAEPHAASTVPALGLFSGAADDCVLHAIALVAVVIVRRRYTRREKGEG